MAFSACKLAFLVIVFFSTLPSLQEGALLDDDQQALLQIRLSLLQSLNNTISALSDWISLDSTSSTNSSSSATSGPCAWSRVSCSSVDNSTRVTGLDLSSLSNISTPLVSGFSNLSSLFSLNLSHNSFTGFISEDIANCTNLISLDLSYNNFSSLVSLSPLSSLQTLNLSANKIVSSLSQAIPSNCSALQFLIVSTNSFEGLFSVPWQDCNNLQTLDLSYNLFTDSNLPVNLTSLSSLRNLNISGSKLLGPIAPSLCSKSALQLLDLSDNNFTGGFPLFLTNCSSLQHLDISGNKLAGELSSEVGDFIALEVLNLSENSFNGSMPPELGNISSLQVLMAGSNFFVGSIPNELSNCKYLSLLDLDTNSLGGNLPEFFNQMPSLQFLVLHSNAFEGPIPSSFFNGSGLKFLDLSSNNLSGSISPQFMNLSSLQFLLLANNQFNGEIPTELGALTALVFLDLSSNKLQGPIPSSVGQLQNLLWLMLAYNELTGAIPPQLGNCTSLLWLNLRSNALTGELPSELATMGQDPQRVFSINARTINPPRALGECLMMKRWIPESFTPYSFMYDILDKTRCKSMWIELLTGIPSTFACGQTPGSGGYIQLTDNNFTGSIPFSFQGNQISMLLLSSNLFIGNLPDGLGKLPLRHLNLSRNLLSGPIPSSLGNTTCLALLDLSYNNLSGPLPSSLGNLTQLSSFNVSYNPWLSGSIPSSAQFLTFGLGSYIGDPLLCYDGMAGMREDQNSSTNSTTLPFCGSLLNTTTEAGSESQSENLLSSKSLLVLFILTSSFVLLGTGLGIYVLRRRALLNGNSCHASQHDMFNKLEDDYSNCDGIETAVYMFNRKGDHLPAPCASLKHLNYADILLATNNFSEENILGCGGFGVVYKAKLANGTTVAIKKLVHHGAQGEREFLAEMETLGSIVQENLVPLLGCCVFGAEKLLVYKFLSNGSLEDWLHDREGGAEMLTWARRVRIASNCARALSYLHHECTPVLIHRDMKASNVLLDEEFNGYLADFGLAREIDDGYSHVSTVVAGTLGYVPPEYCQTWRATTKGDVYSFGVVMLELITGMHPINMFPPYLSKESPEQPNDGSLVDWVRALLRASTPERAYHPSVKQSANGRDEELLLFLELAQACTLEVPEKRPSMKTVAKHLEGLVSN
ncbi:hypothetical protein GOP47_0020230 [Adiantum capillus-veneris]|uniref:non-specific serine/threonine protein kinase n=1 Tax=Adiantum capillus-veneris TaxID=13818 RepID=A0A9D4UD11_ADICA|nr:hypothetical protein GOP47_0020230 [Adiantum capillus-veneris]